MLSSVFKDDAPFLTALSQLIIQPIVSCTCPYFVWYINLITRILKKKKKTKKKKKNNSANLYINYYWRGHIVLVRVALTSASLMSVNAQWYMPSITFIGPVVLEGFLKFYLDVKTWCSNMSKRRLIHIYTSRNKTLNFYMVFWLSISFWPNIILVQTPVIK